MAFTRKPRTARLRFEEDTPLAGMEAVVSMSVAIDDFLAIQRTFSQVADRAVVGDQKLDAIVDSFTMFGDGVLIEWNFEDEAGPVPATGEGMQRLAFEEASALLTAWINYVGAQDPNSNTASANGSDPVSALTEVA